MNFSQTMHGVTTQANESAERDVLNLGLDMLEQAGGNFTVEKRQLSYERAETAETPDGQVYNTGKMIHQLIDVYNPVRTDTGESLSNKTLSKNYTVLQNREMVAIVDQICSKSDLTYKYMTTLQGGAGMCMQIYSEELNKALTVNGEKHEGFLTLSNWHDGSGSFIVHISLVRLECANVMSAIKREIRGQVKKGKRSVYRIRHSKDMEITIKAMINDFRHAMGDLEDTAFALNELAKVDASQDQIDQLFKDVVAATSKDLAKEKDEEKIEKEIARQSEVVADLHERMKQPANTPVGMEGTFYHALQAITDYGTRGRNIGKGAKASAEERQFVDQHMGKGADISYAGLELALEMAGV